MLLKPERIGIRPTTSYAMFPTAAVSGFYFSHPESQYFAVGKVGATRSRTMPGARACRSRKRSDG